jgi:hypothetical protein
MCYPTTGLCGVSRAIGYNDTTSGTSSRSRMLLTSMLCTVIMEDIRTSGLALLMVSQHVSCCIYGNLCYGADWQPYRAQL